MFFLSASSKKKQDVLPTPELGLQVILPIAKASN